MLTQTKIEDIKKGDIIRAPDRYGNYSMKINSVDIIRPYVLGYIHPTNYNLVEPLALRCWMIRKNELIDVVTDNGWDS